MRPFLLLLLLNALLGCAPVSVTFTLFGDDARLHEAEVDTDPGADGKIVAIDLRGLIADRGEGFLLGSPINPVDELTARLRKARRDPAVRAVILRINSPGGTVTASDMIYRELRRFRQETDKPIVCAMGEIAASGGYYVALAGDYLIAEPTSITGSIGVIIPTVNVSEGLGRIGVRSRSIVSRPNKDVANPLEPMREEHYAILQELVDDFYARFRALVVERREPPASGPLSAQTRRIDPARLEYLTDGRIMSGDRAAEAGLVDSTGGLHEAFEAAKTLAGIKAAKLVKYYREDADKPRTPYAAAGVAPPEGTQINLVQLRMNGSLSGAATAGAYYLWVPPGGLGE